MNGPKRCVHYVATHGVLYVKNFDSTTSLRIPAGSRPGPSARNLKIGRLKQFTLYDVRSSSWSSPYVLDRASSAPRNRAIDNVGLRDRCDHFSVPGLIGSRCVR
jgi:hypothetical protein